MKTLLRRLAPLLFAFLLVSCSERGSTETDPSEGKLPDDPGGTIIGNPTVPQGTLRVYYPSGKPRFLTNIYRDSRATVTALDPRGNVTDRVSGTFVLTSEDSGSGLAALSLGDTRFELNVSLPVAGSFFVGLTVSEGVVVEAIDVSQNGVPIVGRIEFAAEDGSIVFSSGSCDITPSLDDLKQVLCEKVHECRPAIDVDSCLASLENTTITDEFGLAEDERVTFATIRTLLEVELIEFNADLYCSCRARIVDVSCSEFGDSYVTSIDELWELEEVVPQECGNDEYPGIFLPDEFSLTTEEPEPAVDSLVDALCTTVSSCDPEISYAECSIALEEGMAGDIWDEFGLSGPFQGAPADVIRIAIMEDVVVVDEVERDHCINEHLLDQVDYPPCDVSSGSILNMENYADNCELVLSAP